MNLGFSRLYILGVVLLGSAVLQAEKQGRFKGRTYHGDVAEDLPEGAEVILDQELVVRDKGKLVGDDICGYTLYKSHSEMPFKVVLLDRENGQAKIVLAPGYQLNYERRHKYSFEIAAHDCVTGTHTDRERVHIEVQDVNEFAPEWKEESYMAEVEEGRLHDNIVQLEAVDQDASENFRKICHYHLLTPNVPFEIDQDGVLRNTEPLDFSRQHNYILEVKAEDCGGRQSDKTLIDIKVSESCSPGWKDVSDRVEYPPGAGQKLVLPSARLELCESTAQCQPSQVTATVRLVTSHIGKGCDRDTYSIQSQRKLCGASAGSVDLLPAPASSGAPEWAALPQTDDGKESDQIFSFDGQTNAIEIPKTRLEPALGQHFTVATWMKHEQDPEDDEQKGTKESILCHSDGEKMNRHHYAVFVHNCRLVLLMRQEPGEEVDMNTFKPAEWRWKIPQVCDGQWHHYAVSADFPQVRLYVDGKLSVEAKSNPEIIDDWPLHKAKAVHYTKLVVGACWQGGDKRLNQHFRGYLAGLSVLKGKTESDRVLQCLNNCKEKLDFHAMSEMETGMSISLNSEMTEIVINGHKVEEVEKLLQRVGYVNSRLFPTPGHRALLLSTQVTCGDGSSLPVVDVNASVLVQQAEQPIITITGPEKLPLAEEVLLHGVNVFGQVQIDSMTKQERQELLEDQATHFASQLFQSEEKAADSYQPVSDKQNSLDGAVPKASESESLLDSCVVRIDAILTPDTEHFKYPTNLIAQLGLEVSEMEDSLLIAGADTISNYEAVLRQIMYVHRRPEDINDRTFTLSCTELNGRFMSNQYTAKVSVIHVNHERKMVPQAQGANRIVVEPVKNFNELNAKEDFVKHVSNSNTSIGVVVIIVVCVGFLLFMIVLGVIRIRSAHQRGGTSSGDVQMEERQEMEWDNSALTITVNPMDQENAYDEEHEGGPRGDDSETDDDDASDYHDELESSEDEPEVKTTKDRELEWDDSTLTF